MLLSMNYNFIKNETIKNLETQQKCLWVLIKIYCNQSCWMRASILIQKLKKRNTNKIAFGIIFIKSGIFLLVIDILL